MIVNSMFLSITCLTSSHSKNGLVKLEEIEEMEVLGYWAMLRSRIWEDRKMLTFSYSTSLGQ